MSNKPGQYISISAAMVVTGYKVGDTFYSWIRRWNTRAPKAYHILRVPGKIHEPSLRLAVEIRDTYDLREFFSAGVLTPKAEKRGV